MSFSLLGRSLSLTPTAAEIPVRVALFSAGGLAGAPSEQALAALRATNADVFVAIGGLGRSSVQAAPTLRALASLSRLTLLIRDGADKLDVDQQLDKTGLLLDASPLRDIRIGLDHLVPWPGSDHGRYSLDAAGCGYGADELKRALAELGARQRNERRWLISWQAPEPGSSLAELVVRGRMSGVLSAWPPQAVSTGDGWDPNRPKLVPRAWGPGLEGADGPVMPPGALVLQLEREGPRVVR